MPVIPTCPICIVELPCSQAKHRCSNAASALSRVLYYFLLLWSCPSETDGVECHQCRNSFHVECIRQWHERSMSCPVCRASHAHVKEQSIVQPRSVVSFVVYCLIAIAALTSCVFLCSKSNMNVLAVCSGLLLGWGCTDCKLLFQHVFANAPVFKKSTTN